MKSWIDGVFSFLGEILVSSSTASREEYELDNSRSVLECFFEINSMLSS